MSQDMRAAFPDTILEVGQEDERLVVLVGDIGHFALQPFAEACPGRFYNIGILEPTIVSMAAGLASRGLYPVAHTIAPFLIERSFEQIKLDFCYQGLGGTLMSVGSAFEYSTLGATHHCYDDFALVGSLPDTEIIYPASPDEMNLLFRQTYANGKLTYIRMTRQPHGVLIDKSDICFGKGIRIKTGKDITLVATGPQLKNVMEASTLLQNSNIDAEVLYYPTLKPFDEVLVIKSVQKTKNVLTVEEHARLGGLEEKVMRATCNIDNVHYGQGICLPERFLRHYGTYQEHCEALGFSPNNISKRARNCIGRT